MTRGYQNNNPGNVDRTNIAWAGMASEQKDPRFITFTSGAYGFRCMARIIRGHFGTYNTVEKIIARWAPAIENETASYIKDVADRMGVSAKRPLTWDIDALPLLRAIAIHENGTGPDGKCLWPDSDIIQGISMEATS